MRVGISIKPRQELYSLSYFGANVLVTSKLGGLLSTEKLSETSIISDEYMDSVGNFANTILAPLPKYFLFVLHSPNEVVPVAGMYTPDMVSQQARKIIGVANFGVGEVEGVGLLLDNTTDFYGTVGFSTGTQHWWFGLKTGDGTDHMCMLSLLGNVECYAIEYLEPLIDHHLKSILPINDSELFISSYVERPSSPHNDVGNVVIKWSNGVATAKSYIANTSSDAIYVAENTHLANDKLIGLGYGTNITPIVSHIDADTLSLIDSNIVSNIYGAEYKFADDYIVIAGRDEEYNVVVARVDDSLTPTFSKKYTLPRPPGANPIARVYDIALINDTLFVLVDISPTSGPNMYWLLLIDWDDGSLVSAFTIKDIIPYDVHISAIVPFNGNPAIALTYSKVSIPPIVNNLILEFVGTVKEFASNWISIQEIDLSDITEEYFQMVVNDVTTDINVSDTTIDIVREHLFEPTMFKTYFGHLRIT